MKKSSMTLSGAFVVCFMLGCAATAPLSNEAKSSINTVHIPPVVVEGDFYLDKRFSPALGLGGAILSAAENIARAVENPEQALQDTMLKHGIIPSEILRNEVITAIEDSGVFEVVNEGAVDAELRFTLVSHFYSPVGLESTFRPSMRVKCELVKINGTVLWKSEQFVLGKYDKRLPGYSLAEMLRDPNRIVEGFTAASQLVSNSIVKTMMGE